MRKTIQQCRNLLFPLLIAFTLIACARPPAEKPVVVQPPPVSDALVYCAAMPAHPCPKSDELKNTNMAENVSRETFWNKFSSKFYTIKPLVVEKMKEQSVTTSRVCTEKQRLRWEAMVMHWGRDCESKLKSLRGIITKKYTPPI